MTQRPKLSLSRATWATKSFALRVTSLTHYRSISRTAPWQTPVVLMSSAIRTQHRVMKIVNSSVMVSLIGACWTHSSNSAPDYRAPNVRLTTNVGAVTVTKAQVFATLTLTITVNKASHQLLHLAQHIMTAQSVCTAKTKTKRQFLWQSNPLLKASVYLKLSRVNSARMTSSARTILAAAWENVYHMAHWLTS